MSNHLSGSILPGPTQSKLNQCRSFLRFPRLLFQQAEDDCSSQCPTWRGSSPLWGSGNQLNWRAVMERRMLWWTVLRRREVVSWGTTGLTIPNQITVDNIGGNTNIMEIMRCSQLNNDTDKFKHLLNFIFINQLSGNTQSSSSLNSQIFLSLFQWSIDIVLPLSCCTMCLKC